MTQPKLIGPGTFVAIGGPSGVGKDTLIRYARDQLGEDNRFFFVRRTITRAAGDPSEDNISVDGPEFHRRSSSGAFAVSWSAHGLSYGLPIEIDDAISDDRVVVANVSRTVLPQLRARYGHVLAIAISADRQVVQGRLLGRAREDAQSIRSRVDRTFESTTDEWLELSNSGPLAEAGEILMTLLVAEASLRL